MEKPCYIYTLDGLKAATCSSPYVNWAKREVVKVKSLDDTFAFEVLAGIAARKYEGGENTPTFYAC